jgi:hypothetical protein
MAITLAAAGLGALALRARSKRSAQIEDMESTASLPETQNTEDLYDPLRRGPRWATDWLGNRALHFRKRWPQPYSRPLHDNGQHRVLLRSVVGPETAKRMQHVYAETLPNAPPFTYCKTINLNRQIQPYQMPAYQPGLTYVDPETHDFNRNPMPYNYPAGHALA